MNILFPKRLMKQVCFLIFVLITATELSAEDWPQWRGPNREGVWRETGVVKAIPPKGLKVRWHTKIGRGYSGPVVAHGRIFVTDHQFNPEVEQVLCFEEETGKPVWSHSYPVDYEDMEYGNGPRASPTVHKGKVYTLGTQGHLCCLDATSGKLIWQKNFAKDFDAQIPRYGASAAPLVVDDLLIVCVGGKPNASVVAFDLETGETRWKALDDKPAYSAPMLVHQGGVRQAIVWTADNIVSLNPGNGKVYWQEPWKSTFDPAQVVASPVLLKDRLLFVMAWNRGSKMIQLDAKKPAATVLWKTRTRPTTSMSTPLFIDENHFCSIDNVGGLCCLDANSGKELWRTTEVAGSSPLGHAHLTPNGDQVFLFNQRGQLISAKLTPAGYQETGRTLLVEPTAGHRAQGPVTWAHPAYANKHVIARNDRVLVSASLDAEHYPATNEADTNSSLKPELLSEYKGRNSALSLDFSPDGKMLALGTWSGKVKFLELPENKELSIVPPSFRNNCCAVSFSPDGKLLAYAGGSEFKQSSNNKQSSGKVLLWNMTAGTSQANLTGHTSKVTSAIFSPDGNTLATGSADKTIRLWDVSTNQTRAVLKGHTDAVWSLDYAPDGKTLVSTGWDGMVKFWNPKTGIEIDSLKGHDDEILSVAISPDGTTMATGGADWIVRLWDLSTRKQRAQLEGHKGGIYSLSFSPDSKTLATGSGDETAKLWNVDTAEEQLTLFGHRSGISVLHFSPDGKTLVTAGRDDPVRLWKLPVD